MLSERRRHVLGLELVKVGSKFTKENFYLPLKNYQREPLYIAVPYKTGARFFIKNTQLKNVPQPLD